MDILNYKVYSIFAWAFCLVPQFRAKAQFPELIVKSGQILELPARTHQYSRIDIEKGARLTIKENSQAWCILYCTGDVTIKGAIIFRKFLSTNKSINAISPSGEQLTHTYSLENIGGGGGDGGEGFGSPRGIGGGGAQGTNAFGGGGGSGAAVIINFPHPHQSRNGNNGNGSSGGRRQFTHDGEGGDGGKRGKFSNGGLLFIYCQGDFDGEGGEIHLQGEPGENGQDGLVGEDAVWLAGGGGGGGGAPGGEGGRLLVKVSGNYISYPTVFVEGGKPGKGGLGKNNVKGQMAVPPLKGGKDGRNGEEGAEGLVDFLN